MLGNFSALRKQKNYGFPKQDIQEPDPQETPVAAEEMDLGFGVKLTWSGKKQVKDLFTRAVKSWSKLLQRGTAA